MDIDDKSQNSRERERPSSFLYVTSTRSQTIIRHLFVTLNLRWLPRVSNSISQPSGIDTC